MSQYDPKRGVVAQPQPVEDRAIDQNFLEITRGLNRLAEFFYFGTGVPTFTPVSPPPTSAAVRALYIRTDGGAGSTLYVYEGAAWAAK